MAACHDQFTLPNAKASLPPSEKRKCLLLQSSTHLAAKIPVIILDRYEDLQPSSPPLTLGNIPPCCGLTGGGLSVCKSSVCGTISLFSHFLPEVVCAEIKVQPGASAMSQHIRFSYVVSVYYMFNECR